ncbi:MAG TPA: hypothetical protein VN837_20655 [Chloroflexota bacterium]|nr:hypothetical protein [Chloroflexota bacterium]
MREHLVDSWEDSRRARRRRRQRWRRVGVIVSVAGIAAAVYLLPGVEVTQHGAGELVGGRNDTRDLLLPLSLFIMGMAGLAACLR